MRGISHTLTRTRTRKVLTAVISTLLIVAAVSFGYWALMGSGKGSTAPTAIGKASIATEYVLEPSFTAGLIKPGFSNSSPLTIKVTNAGAASQIKKISAVVTVDAEHVTAGCLAAWFSVGNLTETPGTPIPIPVKASTDYTAALGNPVVRMAEEASDQKSCLALSEGGVGAESAKLTVSLTASP
jgi:hypothetical protein